MRCPICAKRRDFINELDECKTATERESKRTNQFDSAKLEWIGEGKVSELKECCGGIVGSKTDSFLGDKEKSHYHECPKCGKRFPEQGSYVGDYVNDDLRSSLSKFRF